MTIPPFCENCDRTWPSLTVVSPNSCNTNSWIPYTTKHGTYPLRKNLPKDTSSQTESKQESPLGSLHCWPGCFHPPAPRTHSWCFRRHRSGIGNEGSWRKRCSTDARTGPPPARSTARFKPDSTLSPRTRTDSRKGVRALTDFGSPFVAGRPGLLLSCRSLPRGLPLLVAMAGASGGW